jgi:hypothetical protein
MEIKYVKLNKGQYLSEVEPFKSTGIPTNHIIHKTVTGCGITTLEIVAKRHSIIILPNVPVIQGKVNKQNTTTNKKHHILGIYKGVEIAHIEDYIKSDNVYKKILTTPEGFVTKIVEAFKDNLETLNKDYFLLFDECERLVTDVSYRGKIAAPIKYFFEFDNKALVSATTLPFSDERFKGFKHIIIEPTYDFSKSLKLIETNNVLQSFKRHVDELKSEHIAVFLNSTNAIYALIERMGIQEGSYVFCGQDSVFSLRGKNFRKAWHTLDTTEMKKYTFFTSRFFSGVDIEVDYQPDVILITDVYFAEQSILDPFTEVIQIAGRYRNGIKSLTHISNFNPSLNPKSEQESRYYLQGCFDTYKDFVKSYEQTENPGSKDMFKTAIENSIVHNFFDDDVLNSFMVDNFLSEERVKGYYQNPRYLKEAYEKLSRHFKVSHSKEEYALGDYHRLRRGLNMGKKEHYKEIVKQIDRLTPKLDYYVLGGEDELNYFRGKYPQLCKAYKLIGLDKLEKTGYTDTGIEKAIKIAEQNNLQKEMASSVYEVFEEGVAYSEQDIVERLSPVYTKHNVVGKASAAHIKRYFIARRGTENKEHVYRLTGKIYEATIPRTN